MQYVSTRGEAPPVEFADALLAGLAPDGGLYVPERVSRLFAPRGLDAAPLQFTRVASGILWWSLRGSGGSGGPGLDPVEDAYATFDDPDVCPVIVLSDGLWVQELWHGPTLAFKDVALQLVGRLFDDELQRRGERVTIVVATSGDTGAAAIEACVGRERIDIVVLHPAGRVSDVQRRMMTTVDEPNVHNVAIEGTF